MAHIVSDSRIKNKTSNILREGTRLTVEKDTTILVENVKVGDMLLCFNPVLDVLMPTVVTGVQCVEVDNWISLKLETCSYEPLYYDNGINKDLVCGPYTKILSADGVDYRYAKNLTYSIGGFKERVLMFTGQDVNFVAMKLADKEAIERSLVGYIIQTDLGCLIANGFLLTDEA